MSRAGERRPSVRVRSAVVQVPLSAVVVGWVLRKVGGAGRLLVHPLIVGSVAVLFLGGWLLPQTGPVAPLALAAALVAGCVVWRCLWPSSYRRIVVWPIRSWWRHRRVYRRGWAAAMLTCDLAVKLHGTEVLPRIVAVRCTDHVDRVWVHLLAGQVPADYATAAQRLAQTFGARECRVRTDPAHGEQLVLWFLYRDPLTVPVRPHVPEDPPQLHALPVATGEDGCAHRLRLLGTHLLLVGATGAGKSSVIWSMLHALSPGIGSGTVAVWVLDPKGGMELAPGRALFARFCHGDDMSTDPAVGERAYAEVLEDAVAVMRQRQTRLRGVTRLHHPVPGEPLIVVVVDELASLTSYVTDRDAKKRISAALNLLLSQGRAVGITVIAALQDPRKEVLPARDLFPTRVGLRMVAADQVDLVLGDDAHRRGAACERIPEHLPGIAYVAMDGTTEPVRVRFAHLTDADITALAENHRSLRPVLDDQTYAPVGGVG